MNSKTRSEKLVVVGGCAAGMSAASKAKRLNSKLHVIALEKTAHVSYSACGIPYYIADIVRNPAELVSFTPTDFKIKRDINVLTQHEVVEINPVKRKVTAIELGAGKEYEINYDKLVLSIGGKPVKPQVSGLDGKNVFTIQTLDDGIRLKQFVAENKPSTAVLIGGGYIAAEMAEALAVRGLAVTIVEKSERILSGFESEIAEIAIAELQNRKIKILSGTEVVEVTRDVNQQVREIKLCDGSTRTAELVLVCAGVQPNTTLAQAAGVRLGNTGAISVDWKMQTNVSNIYAAGDCVEVKNLVSNKPDYVPLGPTANKQGRIAGENIGGGTARFRGVVGTSVFQLFDLAIARTGLNINEALEAGFHPEKVTIHGRSKAGYFIGSDDIAVTLIFDKRKGQFLGAQMAGRSGVSKRIDIFAMALTNRMTLEDMAYLDLSYAPPFAPVWDPVLVAVNAARGTLRK